MPHPKYDVFVSYSRSDFPFVQELTRSLEERGVSVWYDAGQLRIGDSILRSIENALEQSRYFVLVISPDYLSSQWSNFEMGVALGRDPALRARRILPILVKNVDRSALPPAIASMHGVDAQDTPVDEIASKVANIVTEDKHKRKA
jgi:predicted nucleotide-binding protein